MSYNELKNHGTADFPMELYHLTSRSPNYRMAHHWHTALEIIIVLSGTLAVSLNDREYTMHEGDVVFVNSEIVHGAIPYDCIYECLVYHPDGFEAPTPECRAFTSKFSSREIYVKEFISADESLAPYVTRLFDCMREKNTFSQFFCIGALFELYGAIITQRMFREHTKPGQNADNNILRLKRVLSYIRTSFDSQITLSDMASVCEMSPKYFCSYFRKMTKKSPVEHLISYRIERATELLTKTDTPVTEIALSCGFNDLSYFIKTFRRLTGSTPGAYRRNNSV